MPRSFRELLDDFEADPARWEIIRTETVASTSVRNRGGTSTQELLRN